MRIAKLTGSDYEWVQHIAIALECGVTGKQADDLAHWRKSKNFSDEERAVLQYVDEMTVNVKVSDGTFYTLQKYLSEENVVDLTLSVGYWGMVARVLVALQVDIDKQTTGSSSDLFKNKL